MTSRTLPILIALFAALAVPAQAANDLGDDPALFNSKLDAALFKGDQAFLNAVMADDFVFTMFNNKLAETERERWDKKKWLGYMANVKYAVRNILQEQIERHENTVIAVAKIHYQYVGRGMTELVQLRVYQQRPTGWKLVTNRTMREEAAHGAAATQTTQP